jgi:N-acetylglucosamine-6-phosphate deacetylase
MKLSVTNGRVVAADGVLAAAEITVEGGIITAVRPSRGAADCDAEIDLDGGWLLPGLIDTQLNGGGGVLFNDATDLNGIRAIGAAHAPLGTTAFLPTLISAGPGHILAALDAVEQAIEAGVPGVLGLHIEGPFINFERKGIHDADAIRRIDPEIVALLSRPRAGRILLTIAPECCDVEAISKLTRAGVIVSLGHSNATYEEARAALDAGACAVTHLFNAMSPLGHRAPGLVGAALADPRCICGLIADGVHVHEAAMRIAIAAKGSDGIMLVTDAMPSVGTDADSFMLQGKRIEVRDGVCRYADGTLAGTDLDMAAAVRNLVTLTGVSVPEAANMASAVPARLLGLEPTHGSIAAGKHADWVHLDADLYPRATWIGGKPLPPHAEPQRSTLGVQTNR